MMTTEEKARAYDEALEKARKHYNSKYHPSEGPSGVYLNNTDLEEIFPALKESEDEKIRKSIIRLLQVGGYMPLEDKEKAFAYLEKQKINTEGDFARGYDCGYECCLNSHGAEWFEKQKEQKPKRERKKPKESWLSKSKYELAHEEELLIERGKELSEIRALKNKDQKEKKSSIVEKLREISTPADEDWFEIEKKWEAEDNEDLRSFISVKFASNAKVIDGKRFAVFTWERFKDIALELINRGEKQKPAACIDFDNEFENQISRLLVSVLNGEHEYNEGFVKYVAQSLLGYVKNEQKPAEYERPLLSKFEQAVYDCAWGKVTCKPEGETQEEYAKRWAEHLLLMVKDWADDYIDSQIELSKRKAYDKGKADAEKPAEWSRQSIIDALTKWLTEKIAPLHKKSLDGTITEKEEMFEAALLEMRSLVNSPDFQIGKDTSAEWSEEEEKRPEEGLLDEEKMINGLIDGIANLASPSNFGDSITFGGFNWKDCVIFLKKLIIDETKRYTFADLQESYKRGHLKGEEVGREKMMIEIQRDHEGEEWINPDDFTAHIRQAYQDGFREGVESIKSTEWSEEDEHCIELLDTIIDSSALIPKNRIKCHSFLKSLHPSWKPSEEQMEALKVVVSWDSKAYYMDGLESLYNDLKKLR